ncbi:hypothetical protein MK280_04370 [Myxococcota bacterium]|nr:hypothetical protein [Myxococcota bacterium]
MPSAIWGNPVVVLLLTAFSLGCAMNSGGQDSGKKPSLHKNIVIQINQFHVRPEVAKVPAEGNSIAWTNWSDSLAMIVFPAEVAQAFTCDEVRPDFVVNGPHLESITAIGSNEDLVTPCPLKPGTYDYQVYLFESPGDRYNPELKSKGQIVVLEPEPPVPAVETTPDPPPAPTP